MLRFSACFALLLVLFFLIFPRVSYGHTLYYFPNASEGQINEALQKNVPIRLLPSHPFHLFILVKEGLDRFFQPSSAKRAQFDFILSGKRLKEAYTSLEKGDMKRASLSLFRYQNKMKIFVEQLKKAQSQNQDIAGLIGEVGDRLRDHEILLYGIQKRWQQMEDAYNFDANFEKALMGFTDTVMALNTIQPGIKNRYTVISNFPQTSESTPPPIEEPLYIETTPSAKPIPIIY